MKRGASNILVVGSGSIGRRHIQNMLSLGALVSVFRHRGANAPDSLPPAVKIIESLDDALNGSCDAVIVANRTDLHLVTAIAAASAGKHLFIEKPLSDSMRGVDELASRIATANIICEMGYMLRFHPNLQWIKKFLATQELGGIHYARAIVGQFLPDWRPDTDYRTCYSAFRSQGGGVIFDLVHDIDVITWLLGGVSEVATMTSSSAALEIETEAIAQINLRLRSGQLAQLHLDYLRPTYARSLEVVCDDGVLTWDYTEGTVSIERRNGKTEIAHRVPDGFSRNGMFLSHANHFLRRLKGEEETARASLADGIDSLRVALACHKSAESRMFVRPEEIDDQYERGRSSK